MRDAAGDHASAIIQVALRQTSSDLVGHLGETNSLPGVELGLRTQLALSLSATRGYAAPEVQFYFVRAELLTAHDFAKRCTQVAECAAGPPVATQP